MLLHVLYAVESTVGKKIDQSKADRILSIVERFGMAPPLRRIGPHDEGIFRERTWEPEDE